MSAAPHLLPPTTLAGLANLELVARTAVHGFLAGLHRSPQFGFSQEFREYRAYAEGDDPRFVDWNVYARTDRTYIRRYEGETNTRLMILVDASASMGYVSRPGAVTKLQYAKFIAAAKALPGVVEIFTGKDVADAKVGGLICGWVVKDKHGQPHKSPPHPVMAVDTVRYVGDSVAMIIANSHDEAKDAAEAVKVDYEVLPANVDLAKAL